MSELVSIIMPVYNAEKYVAEAIDSVLTQSHTNWELLIINDGSTDRSAEIIRGYQDPRIHYFSQDNQGVSAARNVGLAHMKGGYFCFLDGDDCFPPDSLANRLMIFRNNSQVAFVDGRVSSRDEQMTQEVTQWTPNFEGEPLEDLVSLTGKSFFGITWMIKRETEKNYAFDRTLTHGEDLWFYIQMAKGKEYRFTTSTSYLRRLVDGSAMSNLDGLAKGYTDLEEKLMSLNLPSQLIKAFRSKRKSIMLKSYLHVGRLYSALNYYFKPDRF